MPSTIKVLLLTAEIGLTPKYTVSKVDNSGFLLDQAVFGCFGTLKEKGTFSTICVSETINCSYTVRRQGLFSFQISLKI